MSKFIVPSEGEFFSKYGKTEIMSATFMSSPLNLIVEEKTLREKTESTFTLDVPRLREPFPSKVFCFTVRAEVIVRAAPGDFFMSFL